MKGFQARSLTRWLLSVGFAAVSVFFIFSGLVTAMFATGRPPDEVGLLWRSQARFRLALGTTFWLVSVLVFLVFRRGGLPGILRGEEIKGAKRWSYIILLGTSMLVALYSWFDVFTASP
jgi:hypothetical protein